MYIWKTSLSHNFVSKHKYALCKQQLIAPACIKMMQSVCLLTRDTNREIPGLLKTCPGIFGILNSYVLYKEVYGIVLPVYLAIIM